MDIDAFGAPSSPKFQISYGFCPSLGVNRWLLSFGGTLWKCQVAGSTRNTITDFNIDVKYQNLEINFTGSSTWGNFNGNDSVADPLYRHNKISGTAFNVFLPPLD